MPPNRNARNADFVGRLAKLPAGERARLKRSAGKALEDSYRAAPLFFRLLPPTVGRFEEATFFLLATLYPLAPARDWDDKRDYQPTLGETLRQLRAGDGESGSDALDRRFEVLLDADEQQLPYHLRQMIRRLGSNDIPVQWDQLLGDLLGWTHPSRYVQLRWARDYFRAQMTDSDLPTLSDSEDDSTEEN